MADNFLEKHYAEYEAKKLAWKKNGSRRNHVPLSVVSISSLEIPSIDNNIMSDFYSKLFGFVENKKGILSLPDGQLNLFLNDIKSRNSICFTLKFISNYQFERFLERIKDLNVKFYEDRNTIVDPSGNIIIIDK